MTETQFRNRVLRWQKILSPLGIGHFELDIELTDEIESPKAGTRAQVTVSPYYAYAHMEFRPEILKAPDSDHIIVHELLHVAWRDYDDAVHSICDYLSKEAHALFHQRMDHEMEGLLDNFARLIVALHAG